MSEGARVTLAHGAGGRAMRALIEEVFLGAFGRPAPGALEDQARLPLPQGGRLAFTADGFVVDPLFFPGGDIGTLAVNGTVNDLAVGGARPLWLSVAAIVEEGLEVATLRRVAGSMARAAERAGVAIVTGDTKVVGRGAADKLFLATSGIGVIPEGVDLGAAHVRPGDAVLVNGPIGDHGAAILAARGEMALDCAVKSDCAPLAALMQAALAAAPGLRAARDATRGGLASALAEIAAASATGIEIDETALPLRAEVRGLCDLLGLDPLYLANEGTLVAFAPAAQAEAALAAMRRVPEGREARIVGRAVAEPAGRVLLRTPLGGARRLDMLAGEQLPRIC